jgi:hypothetical protein
MNWRAEPLTSIQVVLDLIASTTTTKGLAVKAKLDNTIYEKGIVIKDKEFRKINIDRNEFHGEWNYKILPKT